MLRFAQKLFFVLFLGWGIVYSIMLFNYYKIVPTKLEINYLVFSFKKIHFKNPREIINLQNRVINEIAHSEITKGEINIINNLKFKRGACYDRSLILQKLCIINNIDIRPVYIFYRSSGTKVYWYDIFDKDISSHSIFEFYFQGNWYVMRTNSKMKKLETISEYFRSQSGILKNGSFIRHLSNRNGKYVYPSYIPDVY